jgi:hypothetical protein
MKRWESAIVPGGLAVASLVFFFAAVKPSFSGSPLNVPFLLIGIVCLAGGIVLWRKRDIGGTPRP